MDKVQAGMGVEDGWLGNWAEMAGTGQAVDMREGTGIP